jgi:hypothetical protein
MRGMRFAIVAAAMLAAGCGGTTGLLGTAGNVDGNGGTIAGVVSADGVGRGGVQVIAIGAQRDSTTTDGTGTYRLQNVNAGQYTVSVRVPIGFQLAAGQTSTQTVTVVGGSAATANFALQSTTTAVP